MQTKVMNEGAATYVHYRIVTTLHDEGRLSDGAYMEFLQTHTNVVYQPMFDTPGRSEEHTSELQSLMRISYAVFCLKKKNNIKSKHTYNCMKTHNDQRRQCTHHSNTSTLVHHKQP